MKIVLAGGTGFIGSALADALIARGETLMMLARNTEVAKARFGSKASIVRWGGTSSGDWPKAIDGADAVINLCGENVAARRWTPARKLALIKSRTETTRALVAAVRSASKRPKILVNASAVGFYGNAPEGNSPENSAQGRDFLAALCGQWEREARETESLGVRVVLARFGVVLGEGGGALARMTLPFKLFVGGPLGSGRQAFSWIHRDDVIGGILFALDSDTPPGPVNFVAPGIISNREFCAALGRRLGRPSWLGVPAFALRLALGEMAEMLLSGQRAIPQKLLDAGYAFKYGDIDAALSAIH